MKNYWVWAVIVVIILVAGYLGRHQIKAMLGMTPAPVAQTSQSAPAASTTSSAAAPSDNIYLTKTDPTKGSYLTDFDGKTLYIFDKDQTGVSNCTGSCATLWPFYTSGATAESILPTNITVITRTDGSKQFAWKGMPLYYYSKDTKAGDITGDGVGGVWHLAKP